MVQRLAVAEHREDANLLYVAITRARQCLIISGCKPNKGSNTGWYGLIRQQLATDTDDEQTIEIEYGTRPTLNLTASVAPTTATAIEIDPRLSQPIPYTSHNSSVAPSDRAHARPSETNAEPDSSPVDEDAQLRGQLIHRLLQLLSDGVELECAGLQTQFEYGMAENDTLLEHCLSEAQRVIQHPDTRFLFEPENYLRAYNEVPIQYSVAGRNVFGIIDRLVVHEDSISLIDYKTRVVDEKEMSQALLEPYRPQLSMYAVGVSQLWPDKTVRPMIVFTHDVRIEAL